MYVWASRPGHPTTTLPAQHGREAPVLWALWRCVLAMSRSSPPLTGTQGLPVIGVYTEGCIRGAEGCVHAGNRGPFPLPGYASLPQQATHLCIPQRRLLAA